MRVDQERLDALNYSIIQGLLWAAPGPGAKEATFQLKPPPHFNINDPLNCPQGLNSWNCFRLQQDCWRIRFLASLTTSLKL